MTDATTSPTDGFVSQSRVRQWAVNKGLHPGKRGRLRRSIVEAYLRDAVDAVEGTRLSERPASTINTFDPLADYLEPRFGNIYDFDEAGSDVQPWTDELKEAVTDYLLHEVSDVDYATFLEGYAYGSGPSDRRAEHMAWIMDYNQPQTVAFAFHQIAVKKAPTLDAVLKQQPPNWEIEDLKFDAAYWLQAHATYDQLVAAARRQRLGSKLPTHETAYLVPGSEYEFFARSDVTLVLTRELSPDELLAAWDYVADSSPTDLTDEEWALLQPLVPRKDKVNKRALPQHQAINGMLYQHAHRERRLPLPTRYGSTDALSMRRLYYRREGVFERMLLAALASKPEAARITAWLRSELHLPENVQERH